VADSKADVATPAERRLDERVVHRGPIQRVLVTPEIGALFGIAAIWIFFWATTNVFGTSAGFANYMDVASTTGIMAVAVALLMIGGEFDLSAGIMTGATGILFGLLAKEAVGLGISVWIAVPLVFAAAAIVGWFNAQFVNRTALPSFIVTLGTFFVIKGAVLGYTKRFTNKVLVDDLDTTSGFDALRPVFASQFETAEFGFRDEMFTILLLVGVVLMILGIFELTYIRGAKPDPRYLGLAALGTVAGLVGFFGLLRTDGVGSNLLFGALVGGGIIIGMIGVGRWRYEPALAPEPTSRESWRRSTKPLVIALAVFAAGVIAGLVLDAESLTVILPGVDLTAQALRAILFIGLGMAGITGVVFAARAAHSPRHRAMMLSLASFLIVVLAFVIREMSASRKLRVELFAVMLLGAAIIVGSAIVESMLKKRGYADRSADRLGRLLVVIGLSLGLLGIVINIVTVESVADLVGPPNIFRISVLWFVSFTAVASFVLKRTRFGNWIFAVGGNVTAARSVGVPAARTKTTLFIMVSMAAALVGMILAFRLRSVQATQGDGNEFFFIIAAVVGGNALTGGYGSAFGAAIGALIIAMVNVGIPFAGWNTNWRFLFLGGFLLIAVSINNFVRERAEASRG
jgi:ribose/xylose/arabinose/galactoside ABC-type transport system permease subunit